MHPKILLRDSAHVRFQQAVVAFNVGDRVVAGKILERRSDDHPVSAIARQPLSKVGHDRGAGNSCQSGGRGVAGGGDTEKFHHRRTLVAVTLIGRKPHGLILLEGPYHGANIVFRNWISVAAKALKHNVRQQCVFHGAIHHIERQNRPQDTGGDFDGGEMAAHQDCAASFGKCRLQVLKSLHVGNPV
jgi:hypothetical protein